MGKPNKPLSIRPMMPRETDDGNGPRLRIMRPCEGGYVFVVVETDQTTVVEPGSQRLLRRAAVATLTVFLVGLRGYSHVSEWI